ncbi:hypothetical protein BDDG_12397 [Blastomyces dermatitidis ATCC 18188]|uniref:Uncharacterized protein n=2 Tax=Ajellomyces dermatitidis TaxID=5039 RepID=A0A0J9ERS6_AJEDA|nr:hypothetical protein BDDG_12397 [Blastomyces dermatitidis ATCC 18188]
MAASAAAGMLDLGVNVDFGKGGAAVDRFGSDARCDFIPLELEGSVKIKEEDEEEGGIMWTGEVRSKKNENNDRAE